MAQQGVSNATVAGRPQPQTTQQVGVGPFVQQAQQAQRPGFGPNVLTLGGTVTTPLPQTPGYTRRLDLNISTTTGGGTGGVLAPDTTLAGTANVVGFIQVKDPMGTPILVGSGFQLLYLVAMYGGQFGLFKSADPTTFPSFTGLTAASGGGGNADLTLPFEGALGYGMLAMGNASAVPTVQLNLNSAAQIFSTAPTVAPTVNVTCDIPYYAVANPQVEPQGLGTTYQWVAEPAAQQIVANGSARIALPRVAGYLHTLILELRDSSALPARVDAFGSRIRLWIDGVTIYDESLNERINIMYRDAGGLITRPTGILCYSWRESIAQVNLGLADTNLRALPVTPGTLIEIDCAPWGSGGTSPYTLFCTFGTIVPRGALVTGLPQEGM